MSNTIEIENRLHAISADIDALKVQTGEALAPYYEELATMAVIILRLSHFADAAHTVLTKEHDREKPNG